MDTESLLISIVIPTHNRPHMISTAIESILIQNFSAVEIIVINDGSTLNYDAVLEKYQDKIQYFKVPESKGVSAARNMGVSFANGNWILFLDDDDELNDGYLQKIYDKISHNLDDTNLGFLWSNIKMLHYGKNGAIESSYIYDFSKYANNRAATFLAATKIGAGYGFVVKKETFYHVGGFDHEMTVGEDTELVIKMLSQGVVPSIIPSIGVITHRHSELRLTSSSSPYSNNKTYEKIIAKYADFFDSNPKIYNNLINWCAILHFKNYNFKAGDTALFNQPVLDYFSAAFWQALFIRYKMKLNILFDNTIKN